ncbi:MAG: hypothetical protein LLG05_11620 [Porphyromonadaceae bacterium]|nr:hypothetical protein [Porphyromonadaceae bacterium]
MNKLELKHLAPYLPYGLQVLTGDGIGKIIGVPDMIINRDVIKVHFGANLKKKKFDFGYGGSEYNKPANFGYYYINKIVLQNIFDKNDILDFSDSRAIPILHPLSDLIKPCLPGGKIPAEEMEDDLMMSWCVAYDKAYEVITENEATLRAKVKMLPYDMVEWLFEHHFDIYGLVDQNLAVDINTLPK